MAFSRVVLNYEGSNTFAVNFTLGYISPDHVTARVNDEVDGSQQPVYRTLTWLTEGTVIVGGTLESGDVVTFERTTPKDELTNVYLDGDILDDENIDDSFRQAIMIAHEVLDGRLGVLGDNIDMGTNRITNLGEPVDAQDAATKNYIDTFEAINTASILATKDLAEQWASEDEDVIVEAGKYSAMHYSLKAEDFALAASISAGALPQNNFIATADPTGSNDATEGYSVGSRWVNQTSNAAFLCVDVDVDGSAVWVSNDLTIDDLGSLAVLNSVSFANMNATAIASQAEAEAGTATDKLMTPKQTAQAISAQSTNVFSESFESAEQTVGTAATFNVAHSLSAKPTLYKAFLVCKIAEGGYTVGDELDVTSVNVTTAATWGMGVVLVPSATHIFGRQGNFSVDGWSILNKTTGTALNITAANWRIVVRAWV